MMKESAISPPRLWVLLAREAPVGVVFRRGPSNEVQMTCWNLNDDSFARGQWFRGRIYERRCDLSPNGSFLIYFAATWREPLRSWTAISKPPYFTALALWPKGDGWNGGGYFVDSNRIHLAHFPDENSPHPDFRAGCERFSIASSAHARGEDAPVWHYTLQRSGWERAMEARWNEYGAEKGYAWKAIVPEVWRKPHPTASLALEMAIEAVHQANGPWYVTKYRVLDESEAPRQELGHADWAEWDRNGDLLFAQRGCLFRQERNEEITAPVSLLADFTGDKFEAVTPPAWATTL